MDWQPKEDTPAKKPSRHDDPYHHLRSPMTYIMAGGVLLLVLFLFFGIPAMKGYSVYKAMKASGVPDQYITDMQSLSGKLQQLESETATANSQRDSANQQLAACTSEKQVIQQNATAEVQRIDKVLAQCSIDVNKARTELKTAQEQIADTEELIADAGRRICCIARFNDASINAYDVKSDKIVCVKEGGVKISC